MNERTEKLYAIVNYVKDEVHSVDYTLAEAADFLLTTDSKRYEIRAEDCVSAWNIDPSGGVTGVQF